MGSLSVPHSADAGRCSSARSCWSTPAAATRRAPRSPRARRLAQADGSLSPIVAELVRGREAGAAAREGSRRSPAPCSTAPSSVLEARAGSPGRPRRSTRSTAWRCSSRATTRPRWRGCARRWRACWRATGILELPTAAVYLAEAEWRAGNEDAADRAADIALEAAQRQGSNHILMQALADLPAVLSRRIDGEPSADSIWHQLGRALIAQGVRVTRQPGRVGPLPRLRRALARGRRRAAPAEDLQELRAARVPARRTARRRARRCSARCSTAAPTTPRARICGRRSTGCGSACPSAALVAPQGGSVALADDVLDRQRLRAPRVTADRGRAAPGPRPLAATLDALMLAEQGGYLEGARSRWVDERRAHLSERVARRAARHGRARARGRRSRPRAAAGREVLEADPYREAAWRLMMRIAGAARRPATA